MSSGECTYSSFKSYDIQISIIYEPPRSNLLSSHWLEVAQHTGCSKIKISIKSFNSDLLITLLHSFLTSLDSMDP